MPRATVALRLALLHSSQIVAISDRIRSILLVAPAPPSVDEWAARFEIPVQDLTHVLDPRPEALIHADTLIDVIAAMALVLGVDPTWLLTGEYNTEKHRALEAEGAPTVAAVRERVKADLEIRA